MQLFKGKSKSARLETETGDYSATSTAASAATAQPPPPPSQSQSRVFGSWKRTPSSGTNKDGAPRSKSVKGSSSWLWRSSSQDAGREAVPSSAVTVVNGFDCLPELESIQVAPENVASFTLPEDVLHFEPGPAAVMTRFSNGEIERKLHCNIELEDADLSKLDALRLLAKESNTLLLPSLACAATRYLSRCKMDPRKALKDLQATQEWRLSYFKDGPITEESVREDLALGIIYWAGRDSTMRPLLIIRPARIPQAWYKDKRAATDRLVRLLVFNIEYMMKYMLIPGKVEGGVMLLDLGTLGVSQVPFTQLVDVVKLMSSHYVNRVFRFFVLHTPWSLSSVAGMGMRLLSERQRLKLCFVKREDELAEEFALFHIEEDLGGSRPLLTQFYPFPLLPGPFEVGAKSPKSHPVPQLHTALTPTAWMGHSWNPARSRSENTRLEYVSNAAEIFKRLGLTPPPGCPQGETVTELMGDAEASPSSAEGEESLTTHLRPLHLQPAVASPTSLEENRDSTFQEEPPAAPLKLAVQDEIGPTSEALADSDGGPVIEGEEVQPCGFSCFSKICRPALK